MPALQCSIHPYHCSRSIQCYTSQSEYTAPVPTAGVHGHLNSFKATENLLKAFLSDAGPVTEVDETHVDNLNISLAMCVILGSLILTPCWAPDNNSHSSSAVRRDWERLHSAAAAHRTLHTRDILYAVERYVHVYCM